MKGRADLVAERQAAAEVGLRGVDLVRNQIGLAAPAEDQILAEHIAGLVGMSEGLLEVGDARREVAVPALGDAAKMEAGGQGWQMLDLARERDAVIGGLERLDEIAMQATGEGQDAGD